MVKEKRKRGVPYLDSVDLEIMEFLKMKLNSLAKVNCLHGRMMRQSLMSRKP